MEFCRYTEKVVAIARANKLPVHVDGARIFNASVKLGVAPDVLLRGCDSVAACLSKVNHINY